MTAKDDSSGTWITSARRLVAPRKPDPEILIIGRDPRATRTVRRSKARAPGGRSSRPGVVGGWVGPDEHRLRTALVAALIVLAGLGVIAVGTGTEWRRCPSSESARAEAQRLRQLTRAEYQALVAADTTRLETLLAVDFSAISPQGQVLSRQDLITAVGSGNVDLRSIRIDESGLGDPIEVHLGCDIATVAYRTTMDVDAVAPGAEKGVRLLVDASNALQLGPDSRHTDTWIGSGAGWRELRAQTTAVGSLPVPGE